MKEGKKKEDLSQLTDYSLLQRIVPDIASRIQESGELQTRIQSNDI